MASYRRTYRVNSMTFRQPQERLASSRPTSTVMGAMIHRHRASAKFLSILYRLKVKHFITSLMCSFNLRKVPAVVKEIERSGFRIARFFSFKERP